MVMLKDEIAQDIWQCYAVETGRALPAGLADKMAESVMLVIDKHTGDA
jgi:hypothetical protein